MEFALNTDLQTVKIIYEEIEQPNNYIKKYMEEYDLDFTDFVKLMGMGQTKLKSLLDGRISITPEIALRLAKVFNTQPLFWIMVEGVYELKVAQDRYARNIEREVTAAEKKNEAA